MTFLKVVSCIVVGTNEIRCLPVCWNVSILQQLSRVWSCPLAKCCPSGSLIYHWNPDILAEVYTKKPCFLMRLRNSQRFSTIAGSGISAWSMDVCSVIPCKEAVCSSYVRPNFTHYIFLVDVRFRSYIPVGVWTIVPTVCSVLFYQPYKGLVIFHNGKSGVGQVCVVMFNASRTA